MIRRVAMRRAGGSVTVTIPKDMADRHHMAAGEEGFAIATDRGVLLIAYDLAFDGAMRAYDRGAARYRNALHDLREVIPRGG